MKLTIEHLAPYLPDGLKFVNSEFTEYTFPLVAVSNISYELNDDDSGIEVILFDDETHIKPLLRPLSDLTKEIEHNGKKFIPAKVLWGCDADEENDFDVYGTIPEYWKLCIKQPITDWEYGFVQKLFSWHFDVFSLIEQNLALQKQAQ